MASLPKRNDKLKVVIRTSLRYCQFPVAQKIRKLSEINWSTTLALCVLHVAALIVLPVYLYVATPSIVLIAMALGAYVACTLGVTAGYHRLYSHRSYEIRSRLVEALILCSGTLTLQESVFTWAHHHRRHHAFVDTDDDPYSINKGFWYAHFLWLTEKPPPIDGRYIRDLKRNALLRFQDKYYLPLAIGLNALVTVFAGLVSHDMFGAVALVLLARIFVTHQSTWFVNSLAHFWGSKPYSREHTAVNNWIVSLLTGGEGYHNFHHTYPSDYRNGVRWYQWDPTKALIWTMGKLRLATNLRTVDWISIRTRMLQEDKHALVQAVSQLRAPDREHLEALLLDRWDRMSLQFAEFKTLLAEYRGLKLASPDKSVLAAMRVRVRSLQYSSRAAAADWHRFYRLVMKHVKLA